MVTHDCTEETKIKDITKICRRIKQICEIFRKNKKKKENLKKEFKKILFKAQIKTQTKEVQNSGETDITS